MKTYWKYLSFEEQALISKASMRYSYEKGAYIFDYHDHCIGMIHL